MEILNLKLNDDLMDWGFVRTSSQKKIVWKDETVEYDVYKIPVDILVYNLRNGRMFIEAKRFENTENIKLEDLKKEDPKKYNDEVENLIWSTNEERNIATKKDIEKYGQIEPGVVLDDGTVIDGNRRFTCIRRLHREHPDDDRFKYFSAALVRVDGKIITNQLLKEYELRVQFGADEKVGYNVINMNMSIYDLIKNNKEFDYTKVAELINKTPGDINKIYRTCKLVDEFLEYIGLPGEYQIAEDMKIYWPLEPLGSYFSGEGKVLTPFEVSARKHLFFDYLLTLDVSLITQNLRDGLIKKIFKDPDKTNEVIKEHKDVIGDSIQEVINSSSGAQDFLSSINALRETTEAQQDKDNYERKVNELTNKSVLDLPIRQCRDAQKTLEDGNIKALTESSNPIADEKLNEIKKILSQIKDRIKDLEAEMGLYEQGLN